MTSHPSDPGPSGEDRKPPAGSTSPTEPLPRHFPGTPAGSHAFPGAGAGAGAGPEAGGSSTGGRPGGDRPGGFFTWVRSLGVVRGPDRWVGGVSSGLAARTGLDPILVRGLFVLLALFGVGLLLYGLAWAFLPEPDGRIHAEEAVRGTWSSGTTGALVACILGAGSPSIFWADDGILGGLFWSLFWVAGIGLLIYWLSTRSSRGVAAGSRPQGQPAVQDRTPQGGTFSSAGATPDTERMAKADRAAEAGWTDEAGWPAGTDRTAAGEQSEPAGFAWSPPEPKRTPAPPRPRTAPDGPVVALVLGAVLLTLGTVLTLDYLSVINLEFPLAVALAAAAVVNGLAIVMLGALGRSSGFLGFTAVASLIAAAVTGAGLGNYGYVVVANDADWRPDSSRPATDGYALAAGDGELDLRYLSDEGNSSVVVPVSVAASDLTILVPDDIPVLVRTDMLMGSVRIDDGATVTESGSIWRSSDRRLDGPDGPPLIVHVKGFASNVLVTVDESDFDR